MFQWALPGHPRTSVLFGDMEGDTEPTLLDDVRLSDNANPWARQIYQDLHVLYDFEGGYDFLIELARNIPRLWREGHIKDSLLLFDFQLLRNNCLRHAIPPPEYIAPPVEPEPSVPAQPRPFCL